jgi:hypothetical protein
MFMIAPGKNERRLFRSHDLMFPNEVNVRVDTSKTNEGVIKGRGCAPSELSSVTDERRRCNQGAWHCGVTSAMASKTCLGVSMGASTWFACSRHIELDQRRNLEDVR